MREKEAKILSFPGAENNSEAQQREEKRQRRINKLLMAGTVFGTAALSAAAFMLTLRVNDIDPNFIVEGTIENDGKPVDVVGAAFLHCSENGVNPAAVTAEVHTAVDIPDDGLSAQGRIVNVQVTPGNDRCAEAITIVKTHPDQVIAGLKDEITGWEPNIMGDGTFSAGGRYTVQVEEAKNEGIPSFQIS